MARASSPSSCSSRRGRVPVFARPLVAQRCQGLQPGPARLAGRQTVSDRLRHCLEHVLSGPGGLLAALEGERLVWMASSSRANTLSVQGVSDSPSWRWRARSVNAARQSRPRPGPARHTLVPDRCASSEVRSDNCSRRGAEPRLPSVKQWWSPTGPPGLIRAIEELWSMLPRSGPSDRTQSGDPRVHRTLPSCVPSALPVPEAQRTRGSARCAGCDPEPCRASRSRRG